MDGERKSITEWCRIYNISPFTVYSRIDLFGWDAEKAIKTRPRTEKKVRVIYKNGETEDFCSANIAAKKTGLNAKWIRSACNGAQKTYAGYIWKYIEG